MSGNFSDFIEIIGPNGKETLSVEDGSGRMQTYWNGTRDSISKYLKSGEPAFKLDIPLDRDPYYCIKYGPPGIAGNDIPFRSHLAINRNGCVGIGTVNQDEKLEVSGRIKALDLILPTSNTLQLKIAQNNSFHDTFKEYSKLLRQNRIAKIQRACSSVWFSLNDLNFVGSGSFISLSREDLVDGLFLTAAHLVVGLNDNNTVVKSSVVYINNPLTQQWISVDMNDVYYDGTADVALIRTRIDLRYYPWVLRLATVEAKIGDYVTVHGNPAGIDNLSVSAGIVRDNHFAQSGGAQTSDSIFVSSPGINGNSGSPIIDIEGNIVGIFTFGLTFQETLGGGSNLNTLQQVLPILAGFPASCRNTLKKYLGFKYYIATPFEMTQYYPGFPVDNYGAVVYEVDMDYSPFRNILEPMDLLLSYTNPVNKQTVLFGSFPNHRTPGILNYLYDVPQIKIDIIRFSTQTKITLDVPFNVRYSDVPIEKDIPLRGSSAAREVHNYLREIPKFKP